MTIQRDERGSDKPQTAEHQLEQLKKQLDNHEDAAELVADLVERLAEGSKKSSSS